jgi:hypothetical protein
MERPQYHNIKLVRWKEQWNVMEGNGTERNVTTSDTTTTPPKYAGRNILDYLETGSLSWELYSVVL